MLGDYLEIARSRIGRVLQDRGSDNALSGYQQCVLVLGEIIDAIRSDLQAEPFEDKAEEIFFFKEQAPWIWGQYSFYKKLVKIESSRKFLARNTFRTVLWDMLAKAEGFPERHRRVCEYYYEERTHADERLFTRRGAHGQASEIEGYIDRELTDGAYWLAQMRVSELLRDWLTKELAAPAALENPIKLEWLAGVTDTIELFKGLQLLGCFGDMTFKSIMEWVRTTLGVEIGNYKVILDQIRARKITQARFVDKIGEKLKKDF